MLHTLMAISPQGAACGVARRCRSLSAGIESGVRIRVGVKRLLFVPGGLWGKGIPPIRSRCPPIAVVAVLSLTSRGAVIPVVGVLLRAVSLFIIEIVRAIARLLRLVIAVLWCVRSPVSHLGHVVKIAAQKCVGVRRTCFALSLSAGLYHGRNMRSGRQSVLLMAVHVL